MNNDPRLSRLEKVLAEIAPDKRLAIAFSGGLDSRFLSFAAKYLGYTVKLLTVRGPHISAEETAVFLDEPIRLKEHPPSRTWYWCR